MYRAMTWVRFGVGLAAATVVGSAAVPHGQDKPPAVVGTWSTEVAGERYTVVVRPDSSASMGGQIVRWRIAADSFHVALGDEWYVYAYRRRGRVLRLSGGDVADPIELTWVGLATPRPESIPIPPLPPTRPHRSPT